MRSAVKTPVCTSPLQYVTSCGSNILCLQDSGHQHAFTSKQDSSLSCSCKWWPDSCSPAASCKLQCHCSSTLLQFNMEPKRGSLKELCLSMPVSRGSALICRRATCFGSNENANFIIGLPPLCILMGAQEPQLFVPDQ